MTLITKTVTIDQEVDVDIDISDIVNEHVKDIIELINTDEDVYLKIKKAIDEKTEEYKLINGNYYNLLFI